MSLKIDQNYIEDLSDFKWEDWRGISITKEQRKNKDYYFATIIKYYGNQEDSFDYDIGNRSDEIAYIGRKEVYVGERGPDTNPKSKTFGQRITFPAETEEVEYVDRGETKIRTVLIKGRIIFEFTLLVNEKNTANIKKLIGPLAVNKQTSFNVISGTQPPIGVTESIFFDSTVEQVMEKHMNLLAPATKAKPKT